MGIERAKVVDLKKIANPKGNLTAIESGRDILTVVRQGG
jgi:hypothetical protein